jgi:quinol monooxygenase YgiN
MENHTLSRRGFARLLGAGAALLAPVGTAALATVAPEGTLSKGEGKMYGLIGKMTAVAGQRDALIGILLEGVSGMPGCLSYVVAKDPADADAIWITEVWDSQDSHKASLSLPSVREAVARGKRLIAVFGESVTTEPVGGHGLRKG